VGWRESSGSWISHVCFVTENKRKRNRKAEHVYTAQKNSCLRLPRELSEREREPRLQAPRVGVLFGDGEDEGEVAEAAVQLPRGGVGGVAAPHIVPEPHASLPSPPLRRALSAPLSLCPAPRFGSARRWRVSWGGEEGVSRVSRWPRDPAWPSLYSWEVDALLMLAGRACRVGAARRVCTGWSARRGVTGGKERS
jgi:hypothetical protein